MSKGPSTDPIDDFMDPPSMKSPKDEDFNLFSSSLLGSAATLSPVEKKLVTDLGNLNITGKCINFGSENNLNDTYCDNPVSKLKQACNDKLVRTSSGKRYVTPNDFELLKVIGMGAFGKVLQVRNKETNKVLAMKIISKRLIKKKNSYIENVHAERDILTKMRHPFIVTMHCSFHTREKLFIIMDFLGGGELFLRLGRQGIFLEKSAMIYLAEIILALEFLHARGILHRDLKPENILVAADGHLCLTDFGLAKDFQYNRNLRSVDEVGEDYKEEEGRALTICGTQEYMAPEMIARKGYGKAADFWSLGCIAYEMLSGDPPFQSRKGAKDLFRKILNERVKMPEGSSAPACKLLKGLLNRNATARLGATKSTILQIGGVTKLKQQDFFHGLDWNLLEKKEIDPPPFVDVDNEEDLKHFHEEFTKMHLPRSVTEMTKADDQPRRCTSDLFRGFSFIHDDFVLPSRSDAHQEHYWSNIEEDGESQSDSASFISNEKDTPEQNLPCSSSKKKRPPRKRKKKEKIPTEETNINLPALADDVPGTNILNSLEQSTDIKDSSTESQHKNIINKLEDDFNVGCVKGDEQSSAMKEKDADWKTMKNKSQQKIVSLSCSTSRIMKQSTQSAQNGNTGVINSVIGTANISLTLEKDIINANTSASNLLTERDKSGDWRAHNMNKKNDEYHKAVLPSSTDKYMWPSLRVVKHSSSNSALSQSFKTKVTDRRIHKVQEGWPSIGKVEGTIRSEDKSKLSLKTENSSELLVNKNISNQNKNAWGGSLATIKHW